MEANQEGCAAREDREDEAFDCAQDGENSAIVINMTTAKKSRHIRSQAQIEALAKAQTARKENAVRRREEKTKPVAVPASLPTSIQEEKAGKDYRAMYRAQKRELDELRFERAVHERLREVTAPAAPAAPAEPEKPKASIQDLMDIGWRTTGPARKKNVMSHW